MKLERAYISSLTAHLKALEKRSKYTQEEYMAGNNQIQEQKSTRDKKNSTNNQPNEEMLL